MTFQERLNAQMNAARSALEHARDAASLERAEKQYLGRKGSLTTLLKELVSLPEHERRMIGKQANGAKQELSRLFGDRRRALEPKKTGHPFDPTLPGIPPRQGHLHPLTRTIRHVVDIFRSMGYEVVDGPEVELERYNFDLLNIPPDHPARDMQDTFYCGGGDHRVLRTHTSPVQLRALEHRRPPVRLIAPGRVFRHEATDASHEAAFYQCEGLVIDRGIRLTDLFGTIDAFLKALYGSEVKTRAQASYFPFVEPGAEIAMRCLLCDGKGCPVCKQSGWLEMMGCGMVHPVVLKNMKIDPKTYSGFAFGMGIDRLMLLRYGIDDIRRSYSGDPRFLQSW